MAPTDRIVSIHASLLYYSNKMKHKDITAEEYNDCIDQIALLRFEDELINKKIKKSKS